MEAEVGRRPENDGAGPRMQDRGRQHSEPGWESLLPWGVPGYALQLEGDRREHRVNGLVNTLTKL